ncbi:uncharacterized protein LOC125746413 [Brienomyrus brachyistius]|uniref:uncharacterized protein LOC125746413 n=1 Tax=Brienomyrus brachyistius TaxID=42636 RepID=UPI0020B18224|nr:uncharacterized protein LOC125746413 [Brienomyrus brachyistius]
MSNARAKTLCILAMVVIVSLFCTVFRRNVRKAAVTADSETCSMVGRDILQDGGSAVDGAIAALLCSSVMNPHSAGVGGGAIFTVMEETGNVKIINSRETVPVLFKPDLLKYCSNYQKGSQWIGVPGQIRGMEQAHNLYGKLPWAKLFQPAIQMAREGVTVSADLDRILRRKASTRSQLCDILCYGNKTVFRQGAIVRFPKLAETLEIIANYGANAFYTGRIARDLIQDIKEAGGTLTMEDLRSFQAKVADAWAVPIGEFIMYIPPPPAGGGILSLILNIMKGYKLSPSSLEGDQKALTYHRYIEALKFANAQWKKTGDLDFEELPLISDELAERVRTRISDTLATGRQDDNITLSLDPFGTAHVSVLAPDGTAASVTSTTNQHINSMAYSRKTGVTLNSELAGFCWKKNRITSGEEPPSLISPLIVYSKSQKKMLVIGASGGAMITTRLAMAMMNHLWFEKNLNDSISSPVLILNQNGTVFYEQGFDESVVKKLEFFGHDMQETEGVYNAVNAVLKEGSYISAVSDARMGGKAAGFVEGMAPRERLAIGAVVAVLIIIVCIIVARHASEHQCFRNAAVASDSLTCSVVGRDILKQGGSAVDGAIAALLCIYLVNPHSAGLGGGAVFTIMEKTGKVKIVNSRETVPAALKPDLMKDCSKGSQGSQWIGVPGEIRAFEQAHNLYGKLPWAKLFEPAIRLAREGVPVSAYLAKLLQKDDIKQRVEGSQLCEILCYGNKTVFRQGAIMRFPKLAETLEIIANYGANAFYTGRIARDLIEEIKEAGGTLTMEDLRSFQAKVTDAWTVPIDDYVMHFPPPPTGGAILAFLLNVMKGYKLSPSSLKGDQKALTYHRYIEALKFTNAQRKNTGDPDFNPGDGAAHLIEEAFADRVRAMISDSRTYNPNYYNVTPSLDRFGTTHLSVLAADGSAVSVTSTINDKFGSGVYSHRTGVILNNEIADFCGIKDNVNTSRIGHTQITFDTVCRFSFYLSKVHQQNYAAIYKHGYGHGVRYLVGVLFSGEQPPSSMAPSILYSKAKSRTMVIGASGGTMITTGIAMALMNHLWFGMDLEDAIAAPVLFVRQNTTEEYERGFDETVLQELKTFGHHNQELATVRNVVNAVVMEGSCIVAQSDARRDAEAAGY